MEVYKIVKSLFLDAVWEVLYFPVWWYSRGLKKTAFFCWSQLKYGWQVSGIAIILVNFFKPMYGQRGWEAYLLSLMTHFWQVFWRILVMFLWLAWWLLIVLAWLTLPILIVWKLF